MRHSLGRATPRALGYLPTVNSIKADQLRIVLLSFPYLFTPRSSLLYHILRQTLLVNLVQAHSRIYPFPSHTSNPQVNQLRHYLPRSLKLIHLYQVTRPGHTKSYIQTHCTDDSGRPQTSTITGSLSERRPLRRPSASHSLKKALCITKPAFAYWPCQQLPCSVRPSCPSASRKTHSQSAVWRTEHA